jgi:WD40 repeat protein
MTLTFNNKQTSEKIMTYNGHTDFIKALLISRGTLFTASSDKTIQHSDLSSGAVIKIMKGHTRGVECLAMDDNGEVLFSGSSDCSIRRWDVKTGVCLGVMDGHVTSVYSLVFNDGNLWSSKNMIRLTKLASADKMAMRWDVEKCVVDTRLPHPDFVKCVLVIGEFVITGYVVNLLMIDVETRISEYSTVAID